MMATSKKQKIFTLISKSDKKIDLNERILHECSWFQKKKKEKIIYKIWFIRFYENFLLIYKVNDAKFWFFMKKY